MPIVNGKYYTQEEVKLMERMLRSNSDSSKVDKIVTSAVIGGLTGSSIIGGLVGGSFLGGLLGDIAEGDDDSLF